jgi:hypothetical protein|tara:strand:- start:94 stop:330 length:237 start_codon:yes stop_codon:yes gene_type:complete
LCCFFSVFSPFRIGHKTSEKTRGKQEEKKNNNERVKEREIPGGGKTCIIFDLSQRESKAFCDLIRTTTTLRARTTQQR